MNDRLRGELPANIYEMVAAVRRWTADWLPRHLPSGGFFKSASMLCTEFDVYTVHIEQRRRYSRRGRCGYCGQLIDHGQPRIVVGPHGSTRDVHYHHSKEQCA